MHIIDPFTGTGTFITRLLQSGLISKEQLPSKYKKEVHANEIILLAYYIAAINIEAVYHSLVGGKYQPFEGICLTDTFQLHEKDDLVSALLVDNSGRRKRQKELDIRVIMGNPPYSAGQGSANDNNQNVAYPELDKSIRDTYAAYSTATNKNALYDSYIRAIRWASDRIGNSGIVGFVTNAGFLEANTADGLRKCLAEEFSSIYVFHLRGNQRTSGELSRKEAGKIFGSGSRAPIAITLFVKNPEAKQHGKIYWHDIGDYLTRENKLDIIKDFNSVDGISNVDGWMEIVPDKHYDWINQRDDSFDEFIKMGDKKNKIEKTIFVTYSNGIKTNSDAWCYNSSQSKVSRNMYKVIEFYNSETERYALSDKKVKIEQFVNNDHQKISWHSSTLPKAAQGNKGIFQDDIVSESVYRPFQKQWLYYDKMFIQRVALMPKLFPKSKIKNLVICVTGSGSTKGFCAFMANILPDLEMISKGQCFPLFLYDKPEENLIGTEDLFSNVKDGNNTETYTRKDGISDVGLSHFQAAYPKKKLNKEDVFYYIYGLLQSSEYRERYADNLSKELPRIPCVKNAKDFWVFSQAGRDLADLHINYETVDCYPVTLDKDNKQLSDEHYKVTKMKFIKKGEKSTVIYNPHITIRDIPLEAYDYVVNGKPALEWVMERQAVTTDKKSGIVNDANLWATETVGNAKYPLELFQRVITVSVETMKIVKALPGLDIE